MPRAGIAALLAAQVACTGCALLIPPSWRSRAPLPLAGPVDPSSVEAEGSALDPSGLSDERLLELVEQDRSRLVELAGGAERAPNEVLQEIANRLPRLQRELESRGAALPGTRKRHPVIR